MVLFNANSLITLVFTSLFLFGFTANAQGQARQTTQAKRTSAVRYFQRVGVGVISIPQKVRIEGSSGSQSDILTSSSGFNFSYDFEQRRGRWIYYGTVGVSLMGLRASSASSTITYSYADTNYLNYTGGGGFYYLTDSSVRTGLGLRTFYDSFSLPSPNQPGVTYQFDYGAPFKNYASLDLQWQVFRGFILNQSFLQPISGKNGTAWLLSLKFRIR